MTGTQIARIPSRNPEARTVKHIAMRVPGAHAGALAALMASRRKANAFGASPNSDPSVATVIARGEPYAAAAIIRCQG